MLGYIWPKTVWTTRGCGLPRSTYVLSVSLLNVTSPMLHIHTSSTYNQRCNLSNWQRREIKHLSLTANKRIKMCTENESKEAPSVKNVTNWRSWVREWVRAVRLDSHSRQERRFPLQHRFRTGSGPRSHPIRTESGHFSSSIKRPKSEIVHPLLTCVFMSWHSVGQGTTPPLSLLSHISSISSTTASHWKADFVRLGACLDSSLDHWSVASTLLCSIPL